MNLSTESLHAILREYFPIKNDVFESDYIEELSELREFGISTEEELRHFLNQNSYAIMEMDQTATEIDPKEVCALKAFMDEEDIKDRIQNGFWYSYPALLRIGIELEFGDMYRDFANRRDGLSNETQNK